MAHHDEPFEISFVGLHQSEPPEGILVVDTARDYVLACQAVRDPDNRPSGLWVTGRPFFAWLQTYCALIDLETHFRELTPRLILADRWRVSIPDWLDDETVKSENLLSLDIVPGTEDDFENALLGHLLGNGFRAPELAPECIVEVLAAVLDPKTKDLFDRYPSARKALDEKCGRWEQVAGSRWVGDFCRSLRTQPEALWHDLTVWALLGRYPEKLIEFAAAPQRVVFLRGIPVDVLTELTLHTVASEVALNQVELFFRDIKGAITSTGDLGKVLAAVSRRLPQEFALVLELLESSSYDLQPRDIELVRETFRTCPGVSSARMDSLDRFVPPPKPSAPEAGEAWGADRWIAWTVEEYLPYRRWQVQNRQFDDQVEVSVQAFTDWYVEEYAAVHQDAGRSLVHVLSQWSEQLAEDELSLVVLVDCLPVDFWEPFEQQMASAGFHRHQRGYRFAPLPSHTEVCKPWLLSGSWEKMDSNYSDLLEKRRCRDWPGKEVHYLPNLKALAEVGIPVKPAILVLNFLQVDRALHTDVESDGSTHREELFRLFARLGSVLKGISDLWQGPVHKLGVYVATDHGATKILEEEKASFDSKVVSRLFPDEECRFAWITPDAAGATPENLWSFGYRFKQPFGGQDAIFYIPRGHNTVKTGSKSGAYVHGGASPEEVIVPTAVFRRSSPVWKEPAIRFVELRTERESGAAVFYILRVVSIRIEIQNINTEAIRVIRADILGPGAEVKDFTTCSVGSQETGEFELSCYFRKSAQDQEELFVQITYELAGEEHTMQASTPAVFKSATTGGLNLRDLS
jgi:hypothetical protein